MTAAGQEVPGHDDVLRAAFGAIDHQFRALVENEVLRIVDRRTDPSGPSVPPDPARSALPDTAAFLATQAPVDPLTPMEYLRGPLAAVIRGSARTDSPRCLANMTTILPTAMPSLAALVTGLNQNLVKTEASPTLSQCERQVLAILHRLTYRAPESFYREMLRSADATLGVVTTGGSLANLTALWAARNSVLPEVRTEGLAGALAARGARRAIVIGPASMHYSFAKAVDILGLGSNGLHRVALDRQGRMDARALRCALRTARDDGCAVLAVVALAGTTDAGAVDPLADAAEAASEAGVPLHVDAAWGAPVLFSRRHRHLLDGLAEADTITVDGHKQLHAPTGVAAVLFRCPRVADAIEHTADYAVRAGSRDLGRRSLEGSRPGSVLLLHAALHLLGQRGYEQAIDRSMRQAADMAESIRRRPELELLVPPELNIVLYRYLPRGLRGAARRGPGDDADALIDAVNVAVHKGQRAARAAHVSRTSWYIGEPARQRRVVALRAVLANPATTRRDIEAVLDEQVRFGDALSGGVGEEPVR